MPTHRRDSARPPNSPATGDAQDLAPARVAPSTTHGGECLRPDSAGSRSLHGRQRAGRDARNCVDPEARRTSSETSGSVRLLAASVQAPRRGFGESEVCGAARAETRFHFRAGITSVVPWLVVSGSGGAQRTLGSQTVAPSHRQRDATRPRGGRGTTMFVCKDDGCTARYTIRFRPEGA